MRLCSCEKELAETILQSRRRSTRTTFLTSPQDRHPCHVYLDYSFSYVVASSIPVMFQIMSENSNSSLFAKPLLILVAMIGGSLLSLANISMQWSTSVYNAPLTTVVALQSSLCVVLGTSMNYFLQPEKTSKPHLLFIGVGSFLIAIVSASRAQILYQVQKRDVLDRDDHVNIIVSDGIPLYQKNEEDSNHGSIELPNTSSLQYHHSSLNDRDDYLHSRNASSKQSHVQLGLIVAFLGGICIGFFTPAFNIAVNDPFQWYDDGLEVPYANLWFAFAFTLCSVIGNLRLMRGTAFSTIPSTTWRNYTNESWSERRLAFSAGTICAFGNWLQFQGGFLAGFAAADMVQAFPLVSTLWDYFLFHEFRQTSCKVGCILSIMYGSYLLGISMLAYSISE